MKLLQLPADILGLVSTIFQDPILIMGLALFILGLIVMYAVTHHFPGLPLPSMTSKQGALDSYNFMAKKGDHERGLKIIVPNFDVLGMAFVNEIGEGADASRAHTLRPKRLIWIVSVQQRFRFLVPMCASKASLLVIHCEIDKKEYQSAVIDSKSLYESAVKEIIRSSNDLKHVLLVHSAVKSRAVKELENLHYDAITGELAVDANFGELMTIDEFSRKTPELFVRQESGVRQAQPGG